MPNSIFRPYLPDVPSINSKPRPSELETSSFLLEFPCSEVGTPSFLLEFPPSELEFPCSEVGTLSFLLGMSPSEVGTPSFLPQPPSSKLEASACDRKLFLPRDIVLVESLVDLI